MFGVKEKLDSIQISYSLYTWEAQNPGRWSDLFKDRCLIIGSLGTRI
jgi:hypothetical protein